ncbi:MAG: phosphatidate cytidylyltransferase [Pseudomonadota bacterium]
MHLKRWITGLVALPFLAGIIYLGGLLFTVIIGIVSIVALWEYYRIVFNPDQKSLITPITITGFATAPLMIFAAHADRFHIILGLIMINLMITAFAAIVLFKNNPSILQDVFKQALGIIYAPLLLTNIILIRNSQDGVTWIFFLFFLVFAADIGAFYAGSFFGRHKLCPAVSPGKTIEGAMGGILLTIIVGLGFQHFFLPGISILISLCLCICVGVIGPIGDLFESILKRVGNIKDSGSILPGHGGILDRIDAILFVLPVLYFFKEHLVS